MDTEKVLGDVKTRVGIIGNAADKFTPETELKAREHIRRIFASYKDPMLVSGRCPMGGVDVWAEDIADELGIPKDIKEPKVKCWDDGKGGYGFKARNTDIAKTSDVLHIILVRNYPPEYNKQRFKFCYHCDKIPGRDPEDHVKSGACWTGMKFIEMGKTKVEWCIIG
jgi:hypothetical protein